MDRRDLGFKTSIDGQTGFGFQDLDERTRPRFYQVKIRVRKGRPAAPPASPFPHPPKRCGCWSSAWGGYKGLNPGPHHRCSSRAELIPSPVGLNTGHENHPGSNSSRASTDKLTELTHAGSGRPERRAPSQT
jgi:hypothetical protein